MRHINKATSAFVAALTLFSTFVQPAAAQSVVKPDKQVDQAASENSDAGKVNAKMTFVQQLQQYYENAKDSGTTTASSAAQWFGEQYETTTSSASEATASATKWVTDRYNDAVTAGDTSAKSATTWLVDDISKIGTWEYKIIRAGGTEKANEKELNLLGNKRWECFAVSIDPKLAKVFYLKRPHRSYMQQLPAKDLLRLAPLLQGGDNAN